MTESKNDAHNSEKYNLNFFPIIYVIGVTLHNIKFIVYYIILVDILKNTKFV